MASLYGKQTLDWLLARCWTLDPTPHPPGWAGDPSVIDPITGAVTSLPHAIEVHRQRTSQYPDFLPKP